MSTGRYTRQQSLGRCQFASGANSFIVRHRNHLIHHMELFRREYIDIHGPYSLISHKFYEENEVNDTSPKVRFEGVLRHDGDEMCIRDSSLVDRPMSFC